MDQQMLTGLLGDLNATPTETKVLYSFLATFGMALMIFCLITTVLTIIALWKVFTKAGEKGWKSLIPIYNAYILFKISGRSFWKYFGLALALGVADGIAKGISSTAVALLFSVASLVLAIMLIVEAVKLYDGLSKNFGHGTGFTVGLIFLNLIFMLILGFDNSQYQGNSN